ncbi:zf-DNL-domain-containing protein [Pholiota conissans]|uniref:Zf-DNL-domain-containing protein n=1 Tax=Pholiota conissans TaxID=109636 RepID=A0A9P5Z2D3_9AGAR|nr:zf-DNL-domain-containing protein [Pholiota conissans]
MLPSRLFRNTGIPPALRSLVTPHASLPSIIAVQLRFRLGVMPMSMSTQSNQSTPGTTASLSTSSSAPNTASKSTPLLAPQESSDGSSSNGSAKSANATTTSQSLPAKMEPRLQITFTCTANDCGERSTHQFTKQAYEKGVVLVQCPKCKNRHLIADHLGWFSHATQDGKLPRIEDILREKGEKVQRGIVMEGGDISFTE